MAGNDSGSLYSIRYTGVVNLSHVLHPGMPQWPGDPTLEYHTVARISRDGYYLRGFSVGEHSGTHMNAPGSFHERGVSIDGYSPRSLVAPAIVLDLRRKAAADPDCTLTLGDIQDWERDYGPVPQGSVVLLNTGWAERWNTPCRFFNRDESGAFHFPGFGLEAVRFLVERRRVAGIGIDTHGVDGGQDDDFVVNRLVLQQPRIVLENLANLEQLPPLGATLVIGVLALEGGSGSPASVLAFVP